MNYPQQGFAPQPQQGFAPQPVAQGAQANLFNQFLSEPPRARVDRSKPADGTYVVRFTPECKVDFSQKDGRPMLVVRYTVLESTVPQMNGHGFGIPYFWTTRNQLQDLAELAKQIFGAHLPQVAQQTQGQPQPLAQMMAQVLAQGLHAKLVVRRSPKQIAQQGYDNAYANHDFSNFSQQPFPLASVVAVASQTPPMASGFAAPQPTQAAPMGMPQAPISAPPAPAQPVPWAGAPQAPAQAQPWAGAPVAPSPLPAPAGGFSNNPAPAPFFIPPGNAPR